ncbi:MAG: hypothetical protein GY795_24615 [Desulfobacterales bacterium]|nr:hypothetical protein [Desulfobacterales bacterium]
MPYSELALAIEVLAERAYRIAESKNWHEPREIEGVVRAPSFLERLALIHSEASEALEAYRTGGGTYTEIDGKPEGPGAELADVIIRCLDTAMVYGFPIGTLVVQKMEYNTTRSDRHGGKVL